MTDNLTLLKNLHNGNQESENELIKNNIGLVAGIAKRFYSSGYDSEELIQIGCMGLIKAIRRFNFEFNVQFSTYAVPLIIGEIKRFIRDDGIIKVSRTHKVNAIKANVAKEKLHQKLKRTPTISEIAGEASLTEEEIIEALEATNPPESIHQSYDDKNELIDRIGIVEEEGNIINRVLVKEALNILSAREKKIVVMRYFYQKTQTEISKVIGVSQVQISRLEKGALIKMQRFLEE